MTDSGRILFDLLAIFFAAKIGGELAERLKQPPVIGEVAMGVLVGPSVLGMSGSSETVAVLSTIGVVILLFLVGLETDLTALRRIGPRAAAVATLGVIVPFVAGYGLMYLRGSTNVESLFLATALVATSVGVTARVLGELGVLDQVESQVILAAAVLDDILGLLMLSVVTGIARAGSVAFADLAFVIAKGLFFVAAATILPPIVLGRHEFRIYRLRHRNALLSVAILACVGFSVLAEQVGLAAIVGAFLAGMGFANVEGHSELKKDISSIGDFLIPLFFVAIGMQVNLGSILSGSVLVFGLVMTAVAIAGKMIGCGIGAKGLGPRSALIIGVGMVPRGEVGLIVATIGMTVGALSKDLVATIVLVSLLSTIVVPPLLPMLFKNEFFKSKSPCPGD